MSRTWRNSWGPELKVRESRNEMKSKQHIRKELEEMEETDVTLAYVVVNEFVPSGTDTEVREDLYYSFTEDAAWAVLNELAEQKGVDLDFDDTSFDAPPSKGLDEETYFIEEIEIHG